MDGRLDGHGSFMLSNSPTPFYVHWQEQMIFSSCMLTVIFALYITGLLGTLLVACGLFASATSIDMLVLGRLLAGVAVGVIVSAGMAAVPDAEGTEYKRRAALLASVTMVLGPLLLDKSNKSNDSYWPVSVCRNLKLRVDVFPIYQFILHSHFDIHFGNPELEKSGNELVIAGLG